jgi:hypothetical protein
MNRSPTFLGFRAIRVKENRISIGVEYDALEELRIRPLKGRLHGVLASWLSSFRRVKRRSWNTIHLPSSVLDAVRGPNVDSGG